MPLDFSFEQVVSDSAAHAKVKYAVQTRKSDDNERVKHVVILRCPLVMPQNITPDITKAGTQLRLLREPDNKYDRWAIKVCSPAGTMLGYLPARRNQSAARLIDAGKVINVFVDEGFAPFDSFCAGREPKRIPLILYMDVPEEVQE